MKQKSTENSKKIIAQAPVSSGSELDDWDVLLEGVKRKIKPTIRIKSINIKTISKLVKEKFVSIPKKEQDVFFDEVRKEAYDPSISLENIMELRKRLCAQFNNNQVFPSWPSLKNEICESAYTIRGQIEKIHGKKVDARLIKIVKNGDLASLKKEVTPENVNIIVSIYAETLLIVAIKNNHTSIVEFLLEQGADINVAVVIGPYKGSTALGHAVFNKRWDLVNKLLEKNPKINANAPYSDDNPGESVLWWAALFNQWQLVSKLLELDPIANIDATSVSGSCQGMTVLWLAANNNEWELVNKMLKHNSNANIEATPISGSLHGKTVLWLATVALQTAMVKILLARGANIDCQFQGMTLIEKLKTLSLTIPAILTLNTLQAAKDFHTLSNTNNIDYNHITTLLDQGAHWNQRDSKGNTPLHVACDLNNADFIKQLAKQPKEYQELILCATNKARDTALDILARNKISYKKSLAALMNIIQPFIFSKIPFYLYMRQISSLIFYTAKFIGKTYFFGTSLKGKELILAELGKICNRQGSQEIFLQRKFEEASKANSISLTFQFNRPLTYGNFTTSRTLPLTNLTSSSSGLKQRDVPDNSVPGECSNMAIETNQEKINDASPDLWEPSKRAKLSC